ncbi:MAG TPA: amino acid permease [Rhizomicrobium sp.]
MKAADREKKLGPLLAMVVVANSMMGSGIYLLPAGLGTIGSVSIIAWVAATLGAAVIAAVFAWLAVLKPENTSLFAHVQEAFGPGAGFVSAALYWASTWVATVAVSLAVVGYLSVFIPWVAKPPGSTIGMIAAIWLLIGANLIGPKFVARFAGWMLAIGLVPILIVAIGGWFVFDSHTFMASWNVTGKSLPAVVPRATVMVFWAFLGIESASVITQRVRNPGRNVPIGTFGGLAIAAVIYIAASAAIMGILPAAVLAKSNAPFAAAVVPMLGTVAAGVIALFALMKASGTLGTVILMNAETAESETMIGQIMTARPADRVSNLTLFAMGMLMSLVAIASASPTLARQFTIVANMSVVLCVAAYGAASLALFRLSRSAPGKYRWSVRAIAVCSTAFCVWLIASSDPDLLVWSAGAVVLALAAYPVIRLRRGQIAKLATVHSSPA